MLSAEEQYRLHGNLTPEHIEELLDAGALVEDMGDVTPRLEEAKAQYPEEDFLEPILSKLRDLVKTTRGANRDDLQTLIVEVEALQLSTHQSSEVGLDELNKAIKEMAGL